MCFPRRTRGGDSDGTDEVFLIEKRRGLGESWYNGPGGKLEGGETPRECAVRETREEVGLELDPEALEKAGELTFLLDGAEHTRCHVDRTRSFSGESITTEESRPEWVPIDDVPDDQMWADDQFWLPGVLEERTVVGEFRFEGGAPTGRSRVRGPRPPRDDGHVRWQTIRHGYVDRARTTSTVG